MCVIRDVCRTKPISDNIASVQHATVPCITCVQLGRGSYVQEQISQGRLQSIECEVQEIERNNRQCYSSVLHLQSKGCWACYDSMLAERTDLFQPYRVPTASP